MVIVTVLPAVTMSGLPSGFGPSTAWESCTLATERSAATVPVPVVPATLRVPSPVTGPPTIAPESPTLSVTPDGSETEPVSVPDTTHTLPPPYEVV